MRSKAKTSHCCLNWAVDTTTLSILSVIIIELTDKRYDTLNFCVNHDNQNKYSENNHNFLISFAPEKCSEKACGLVGEISHNVRVEREISS